MKVVFLEEVEGTALVGEVKEVRNGFARNYLLPRGLAAPVTKDTLRQAERLAKADAIRQDKLDAVAEGVAAKINGAELVFEARVGDQGRLFGSITASDIAEKLSEIAGEAIDHRQVQLGQTMRTLGREELRVRLTRNVFAEIAVEVKPDAASAPEPTISEVVAELEAGEEAEEADATEEAAEAEAADEEAET